MTPADGLPAMLLVREVQECLRLSRNGVYDAIARGDIPSVRIGGRILVPKHKFNQLLEGEKGRLDDS